MKTNFDKWRDSLTPPRFFNAYLVRCLFCPARWECDAKGDKFSPKCINAFTRWANAPAKEEEKEHFADLGKKMNTLPDGTPINLCGGHK